MTRPAVSAPIIFGAFAFAYFLSALLRAVTATLAPVFSAELGLRAADLGLLAGAYFFGFAVMQLPLGRALDRFGPRRTLLGLTGVAVLGCAAFALSSNLPSLIASRALVGAGMAAALMAPLTAYRQHFSPAAQLRANSWMLMTGSLGMVASTVPVQLLLPVLGWRGLFWVVAALLLCAAMLVIACVPRDPRRPAVAHEPAGPPQGRIPECAARTCTNQHARPLPSRIPECGTRRCLGGPDPGYANIVRHPLFLRCAPLGFFVYGGLIAVQSLWAGPWLTRVCGWTAGQAAQGLFGINLAMLLAFATWGALMPRLVQRGVGAVRLMACGVPLSLLLLALNLALGARAGAAHWAAWCVACSFVSLSQPAVAAVFPAAQAGRALSAYNLVIFSGVFCIQWGLGLLIDLLRAQGWSDDKAFRCAFAAFGLCGVAAYVWFLRRAAQAADNPN